MPQPTAPSVSDAGISRDGALGSEGAHDGGPESGALTDADAGNLDAGVVPTGPSLPITAGLVLWLDTADESTLLFDVGLTTWQDKSPAGHDAVQVASDNQPRLVVDALGGRDVVRFDGEDDHLIIDNVDGELTLDSPTVVIVASPRWADAPPGQNPAMFAIRENGSSNRFSFHVDADYENSYTWTNGRGALSAPLTQNEYYAFASRWVDNVETLYLNGSASPPEARSRSSSTPATAFVGSAEASWENFEGDIAEILVYDHGISDGDMASLEAYLSAKWALPL